MNNTAVNLPPLRKVADTLREITETLARELVAPTETTPVWDEFEWRIARAVAAMQGISSLLEAKLGWTGPATWRRFLEEQRGHVAGRHSRILKLLETMDSRARQERIGFLGLKGVALHATGVYEPGERPMADIDLLVRDDDSKAAARVLEDCGFELTFSTWRHQLFESRLRTAAVEATLGEHIDNPIKIELHTSVRERLPVTEVDITPILFRREPQPGLNAYPSPASLMIHLLLHAAGNIRAHALRFIQLCDIARLASRFHLVDWEEMVAARPNGQALWWAAAPLTLTARYFPAVIPPFVLAGLDAECPWLLRKVTDHQCLADVSWSNLRVYALPGIEWSRTPGEALNFIKNRVWPTRDTSTELQRFAAHHPGAAKIPWYGISQRARIFRWIFLRPPRVQALLAVRAALDQPR